MVVDVCRDKVVVSVKLRKKKKTLIQTFRIADASVSWEMTKIRLS